MLENGLSECWPYCWHGSLWSLGPDCFKNLSNRVGFSGAEPVGAINAEDGGKTVLTLRGGPINATSTEMKTYVSMFDSMRQGFGGSFDQLDAFLSKH